MNEDIEPEQKERESDYQVYRRLVSRMSQRLESLDQRITDLQASCQQSSMANAQGLQNVYNQFQQIIAGTFIESQHAQMRKMHDELFDMKNQFRNDLKMVKKCYKLMPIISTIKEFDDESFERLLKVLQLVN